MLSRYPLPAALAHSVFLLVCSVLIQTQPVSAQTYPPERAAVTSIAGAPELVTAKLIRPTATGGRQVAAYQNLALRYYPECASATAADCVAINAQQAYTAPINPVNKWWQAQGWSPAVSGITDCDQVRTEPCVEMSDAVSRDVYKAAVAKLPLTGGTLVVKPGRYKIGYYEAPWLANRASLRIIGVRDSAGRVPVFEGTLTPLKTDPTRLAFPFSMIPWNATNGNLTVENLELRNCTECIFGGSSKRKQIIRLTNVNIFYAAGHTVMIAWEPSGAEDDEIYIHGGEYGMGGLAHTMYLDRTAYQEVIGATIHSPGTQHAIKAIGITVNLIGNIISAVRPDGTLQHDNPPPPNKVDKTKPYRGSVPLSMIACQRGVVAYNTVVYYWDATGFSGLSAAVRQPRHAINGCDLPKVSDPTSSFWQPEFWNRVHAGGTTYPSVAQNTLALPVYWYANRFVLVAHKADPVTAMTKIGSAYVIANQSTYPVQTNPNDAGDWAPFPLVAPPGWAERGHDLISGNCFENYLPTNVTLERLHPRMKHPDGTPINPGKRQWVIGDNRCNVATPSVPAWFPKRLAAITRAQYLGAPK